MFIRLSLVTVSERLAAVPGTRYSCCDDTETSISSLAATGAAINGSNTALNIRIASVRLGVRLMASPRRGVTRKPPITTARLKAEELNQFQPSRSIASLASSNCSHGKNPSSRGRRPK